MFHHAQFCVSVQFQNVLSMPSALASRGCPAAGTPGLRQEASGEALTLFPSQRHQLNQQQRPAIYMQPTQVGCAGKQPFCLFDVIVCAHTSWLVLKGS